MTAQVQKLDGQYVLVLSQEQMQAEGLAEGDAVSIERAAKLEGNGPVIRYATDEEAMQAFESTLEKYDSVYRALAQ